MSVVPIKVFKEILLQVGLSDKYKTGSGPPVWPMPFRSFPVSSQSLCSDGGGGLGVVI